MLILGAAAVVLVGTVPPPNLQAGWRVSSNELTNLLARWDTYWYHSIATTGYHWDPSVERHQDVVFFPLYPLLMRWTGRLLGGHPLLGGLIVSLAAFAGAIALLYRLAALDIGESRAWAAVLLLSTFPYAVFFSAVYTESLFLFLMAGAFYAMRRDRLLPAALCGLAAALARPNGCWLSVSLAFLALNRHGPRRALALAVAAMPLAGTALYSAYLWYRFGDALAWLHGQAAWGLPLAGRFSVIEPGEVAGPPGIVDVIVWTGNIAVFALAMWGLAPIYRRFGAAYASLVALSLGPPVLAHLFMSGGRFAAVVFPLFFWLAAIVPEERVPRLAASFAAIQAVFAILFFLWRPVV